MNPTKIYDTSNNVTNLNIISISGLIETDQTTITNYIASYNDELATTDKIVTYSLTLSNNNYYISDGTITGISGWGIAYLPDVENITGLTENYSVGFFTRHTQTFYEPYLQTTYGDLVEDDRTSFSELKENKLYLYTYVNGEFLNLDENPLVDIQDQNGDVIPQLTNLPTCRKTKGVYEVTIPPISGFKTPCQFYDVWKNLKSDDINLPLIKNEFILLPYSKTFQIGTNSKEPEIFGFDYYGILQDEKIILYFKGGTTMYLIYDNFVSNIASEEQKAKINEQLKSKFSPSDTDMGIEIVCNTTKRFIIIKNALSSIITMLSGFVGL